MAETRKKGVNSYCWECGRIAGAGYGITNHGRLEKKMGQQSLLEVWKRSRDWLCGITIHGRDQRKRESTVTAGSVEREWGLAMRHNQAWQTPEKKGVNSHYWECGEGVWAGYVA